ncbi:ArsR/SmtB family transcription factor [Brevibacillus fluminis]|uniref:ArsR/SmtB family transcription factor n=1 Tax=Brevibacillus fluminis TaxID=511487 RepID=UPI003F8C5515
MERAACTNKERILEKLQQGTLVFQALGDVNRQQILALLLNQGSLNVNQITEQIDLSRPAVSHHLKILRQAGLVAFLKSGKEKYYTLSGQIRESLLPVKELINTIEEG